MQLDPAAVVDDGSCEELDECGVCGGPASWLRPAIVRATLKTNAAFVADLALRIRSATVTAMWRTSAACAAEMAAPAWKAAPTRGVQLRSCAVVDDGSCEELDECGVCGGPGIVAPACD